MIKRSIWECFDEEYFKLMKDKDINLNIKTCEEIKNKVLQDLILILKESYLKRDDLESLINNIKKTKSRWIKNETKKEINRNMLKQLNKWNEKGLLIEYPYIKDKKSNSLTSALKNDLKLILYKLVIDKEIFVEGDDVFILIEDKTKKNKKTERKVSKISNALASIPYNTVDKKGTFQEIADVNKDMIATADTLKTGKYEFVIRFDDDEPKTKLQLTSPKNIRKALSKIKQVISSTDRKIFNYLISQRKDSEFVTYGRIQIPIIQILRNVFNSASEDNYLAVKASIFKMEKIKVYMGNKKSIATVGIFSYFDITTIDNVEHLTVEIHPYLREEILKQHTINLYKDVVDLCPNDDCELLLYFLQKTRLWLILSKKPLTMTVNYYNYFSEALFFTNKRKDRNISRLIESLKFVESTDSVLESFKRNGDKITLDFKDMSIEELNDLNYADIFSDDFMEFREKLIDGHSFEIY